jgi:polyribonucleotide nucleotidyltransferase
MFTIYKYDLQTTGLQEIEVPINSRILCVQVQYNQPKIWILVDLDEKQRETINIVIKGTGHKINDVAGLNYIGSYQLESGNFVGHVFHFNKFHN